MTPPDNLPRDLRDAVLAVNKSLGGWGWCTPKKAVAMATLIHDIRPRQVVEIGVFGGRSLLPQALALKYVGSGVIYGIEPWCNDIAVEIATTAENDEWWGKVDFKGAKKACLLAIIQNNVLDIVRILECRSADAMPVTGTQNDIIHVDGNHSSTQALADVKMALGATRVGGYIWLDDIGWTTVAPALSFLEEHCDVVGKYFEDAQGSYGLFRKRSGAA